MPLHVKLDFTAPFAVGDIVYSGYPPGNHAYNGGPASYDFVKSKISSVKFQLELNHENSCLVKEPITDKELTVETVVYTIVPLPEYHLSALRLSATRDRVAIRCYLPRRKHCETTNLLNRKIVFDQPEICRFINPQWLMSLADLRFLYVPV